MPTRFMSLVALLSVLILIVGCEGAKPTATPALSAATVLPSPTMPPPSATAIPQFSGPYLGQKTPGSSPARFASAMIKGDLHTPPVFMPDGSEIYWGLQGAEIFTVRLENGYWTQPESVAFSASMTDYRDPFISPLGDKLFFLSKGKLPNSQLPVKENIWFVKRVGAAWGEPQPLGEEVNSYQIHWQISVNNNGDVYFTSQTDLTSDIYVSRYVNDRHIKSERLGDPINTDQVETTPYIAPDESYIIFARFKDQNSYPRLFISYVGKDGSWGEPVLIDRVSYGLCPVISPDGKYLFFLSSPQSVSWMSAEFIRELKPDK